MEQQRPEVNDIIFADKLKLCDVDFTGLSRRACMHLVREETKSSSAA
jgi:hypothetical protein